MATKIGRNEACPCGSGKKFKKCCALKEYLDIGPEDSTKKHLIQELLNFAYKKYNGDIPDDALDIFWEDFNPAEHFDQKTLDAANINFMEWLTLDWIVDEEQGKILIDLYIENNKRLTQEELVMLGKLKSSVLSLHEVQEVYPGKGLLVKDLLLGGTYQVKEKSGSKSLVKWDIFAARLLEIDGHYIIAGGMYGYFALRKAYILEDIHRDFKSYKKDRPSATWKSYLKENGKIFNWYWYELVQNPPSFQTSSGEETIVAKSIFQVIDKKAAIASLTKLKDIEKGEGNFVWYGGPHKSGGRTIFGFIRFENKKMFLETFSKERLEKGKALILDNLAGSVEFKMDTLQDIYQAMSELDKNRSKNDSGRIPMDQKTYTHIMKNQYKNWANESIPFLDGKTPVQAMKTKAGRARVEELFKIYENGEERHKKLGEPYFDFSWLRHQLKIAGNRQNSQLIREGHWDIDEIRELSNKEIFEKLSRFGVAANEKDFLKEAKRFPTDDELSEYWYNNYPIKALGFDEDFIWMAAAILWERLVPNALDTKKVDELIEKGQSLLDKDTTTEGCAIWLELWDYLKTRIPKNIKSIVGFENTLILGDLEDWCQEFELQLGNAGRDNPAFFKKRIRYTEEFCKLLPHSSKLIIENMKRARAESFYALGDEKKGEAAFRDLIKEFPNSGWAYIGWADMYWLFRPSEKIPLNFAKAKQIYNMAIEKDVDDKNDVLKRLKELKKTEKEMAKRFDRLKKKALKYKPNELLAFLIEDYRNGDLDIGNNRSINELMDCLTADADWQKLPDEVKLMAQLNAMRHVKQKEG